MPGPHPGPDTDPDSPEAAWRERRAGQVFRGYQSPLLGISQRLPPANLEAEQALLGALLANSTKVYERVGTFLKPEHFADPSHAAIYARATDLLEAGRVVDAVTLRSAMEGSPALEEVGGAAYLADLLGAMVGVINAAEYARIILDCYLRRQILDACEAGLNRAFALEPDDTPLKMLNDLRVALFEVERAGASTTTLRSIGEAVQAAMDAGVAAAQRGGGLSGLSTGFPSLDRYIGGLEPGTNTLLGARPGVGKTALGVQIALRMARAEKRILYVSLEMQAAKIGRRALALASGVGLRDLRSGDWTRDDMLSEAVLTGQQRLRSLPLLIEDEPRLSHAAIAMRARAAAQRLGRLDALIVDHLHIVGRDARKQEREAIADVSSGVRAIAQRMGIPVITLAQLKREVESRDDKRPTMADLYGATAIEADADTIGLIYRPEARLRTPIRGPKESDGDFAVRLHKHNADLEEIKGKAWVYFDKVRDGEEGVAELRFDGARVRFHEADER